MNSPMSRPLRFAALFLLLRPGVAHATWPHDPFVNLQVAPAAGLQSFPDAVPDGAGGAIIVWDDARAGVSDIYAQHVTAQGTIAPGWPTSGLAICAAAGIQTTPKACSDGAGGAIIVWVDARGVNNDIYAMRVTGGGTFPGGWPANGRQVMATGHVDFTPMVAPGGVGGAIVAWTLLFNPGIDHDISGARVNASGTVLWANPLYAPGGIQESPAIVPDGPSGAFVAFEDQAAGNWDVKAFRC